MIHQVHWASSRVSVGGSVLEQGTCPNHAPYATPAIVVLAASALLLQAHWQCTGPCVHCGPSIMPPRRLLHVAMHAAGLLPAELSSLAWWAGVTDHSRGAQRQAPALPAMSAAASCRGCCPAWLQPAGTEVSQLFYMEQLTEQLQRMTQQAEALRGELLLSSTAGAQQQ